MAATPTELEYLHRLRREIEGNLCSLMNTINSLSNDLESMTYDGRTAGESVRANVVSLEAAQAAIRSTIQILDHTACTTGELHDD
jgi:hypothetical protein